MPVPAYRKASRWLWLWLLICLGGVVAHIATIILLIGTGAGQVFGVWAFLVALVPLIGAFVFAWRITNRLNRQRVSRNAIELDRAGFRVAIKPSESERIDFAAPLAHLLPSLGLKTAAIGIKWWAVEIAGATPMRLFEHEFMTGSGKSTQEHHHTVIAWPNGHPDVHGAGLTTAPWFFMARYGWLERRVVREKEVHAPELVDLAKTWSCFGNPSTGTRFLTPAVRRVLEEAPQGEAWSVGAGWICCSFNGTVDARNLVKLLDHARRLLATR